MRYFLAIAVLLCGAVSAWAEGDVQKWCAPDGTVILQIEDQFVLDETMIAIDGAVNSFVYHEKVFTPCP